MTGQSPIARFFLWKRFSSFTYLNITQFLVTLNDSIFRLLVAFSLIDQLGINQSSNILFISGLLFVSPFLIFSMPAGELADKCSKQKVIVWTMVLEILAMVYAVYAMAWCSEFNAYASLFCVAFQASIFLPSKYAILPEIVKEEDLSKANGYMTLATYLAIIFGTFLASFFTQITKKNYVSVAIFCLIIAFLGFLSSLQIEKTAVKNATKKIKIFFLLQVYKSLQLAKQYPHLLLTVVAGAYFVFTASFTQLNLLPYGLQSLKITDVQTGYIFLAAALGVGIGSIAVAMLSGKTVELGIAIWGAFGTSISYIILFLFSKSIVIAVLMILSMGIHGGLYIVPIDAYIQLASPEKDRGEIVAAGSFLGFVGVLLAALCLGFFSNVLQISAAMGYLIVGLLSLIISTIIAVFLPEYFSRMIAITLFKAFYQLEVKNQPEITFYESILLICRKSSFSKILSLIFLYPRISFIRFVKNPPSVFIKPFHILLHITPIPIKNEHIFKEEFEKAVDKKLPLCLFLRSSQKLDEERKKWIEKLLAIAKMPHVFVLIDKSHPRGGQKSFVDLFKILPVKIMTVFSDKKNEGFTSVKTLDSIQQIEELSGENS